jgi:hypothetical protein
MATPIAIGWATVDLDRARREMAPRLVDGTQFEAAPDSEQLGARCLVGELRQPADARWLVLLEPATEGRLAASLARHGEGFRATWETTVDDADLAGHRRRASVRRPGPLGPERLVAGGPVHGPYRLLLAPATIDP